MNFRIDVEYENWTLIPFANHRNLIVRISDSRKDVNTSSVMVSSHFDSAVFSPGGMDDGGMVASMIEIFKNIIFQTEPPKNPIIFYFVNGEEAGLFGSAASMNNPNSWLKK